MAQLLVRDLDPGVIERLKIRARRHGRSLQAEVRMILEAAAPLSMSDARSLAEEWQKRLAGKISGDSSDLIREERDQPAAALDHRGQIELDLDQETLKRLRDG
jgi:antitoxin FitA